MKKAVVTIVVGDKYRKIYDHVAPLNRKWMERWGWDSVVIDSIPDDFTASYSRSDKSSGWIFYMYKLFIPSLFRNYDLIAFVDSDCVFNPNADCLSEYIDDIPLGGFAGVQEITFEERKLFPNWSRYYYEGLRDLGYNGTPRYPERHACAGLLLYRPSDVWERWVELLNMNTNLNEENRLNVYEVQEGRCFFLPCHWHIVWLYERVRRGWSRGTYKNKISRKLSQCILSLTERKKVNMVFKNASMMHFGFEHEKMLLIDPTDFAK
jgi:hypothetical protein